MKTALLGNLSPFTRILFLVSLLISGMIISLAIGMILASLIYGFNFFQDFSLLTDFSNSQTISVLKFLQIVQSIGIFIAPPLLAAWFFERNSFTYLGINKKPGGVSILLVILIMFASVPFFNWMISLNESLQLPGFLAGIEEWMKETEAEATQLTDAFLNIQTFTGFLVNLFMIAILPAIGEELLFRGLLQRLFSGWLKNVHAGIFLSALIFGIIHFQFYGLLPRMIMGVLFGYLFYWSGSLWLPVIAHFINNGAVVIISYLFSSGKISDDFENLGASGESILIILSFLVTILIMFLFFFLQRKLRSNVSAHSESVQ